MYRGRISNQSLQMWRQTVVITFLLYLMVKSTPKQLIIWRTVLSYHDAQLLTIKDVNLQTVNHHNYSIKNINKYFMEEL
jgi:hypothetical protein